MNSAQSLIDTSALARFTGGEAEQHGWDQAAAAGLIATCPITGLEFFSSARSTADRTRGIEDMRLIFGWVGRVTCDVQTGLPAQLLRRRERIESSASLCAFHASRQVRTSPGIP
ncbi:hypothetical protein OG802_17120 [Streptomyces sp. NBC_00704]|uniref:hypothetical protein n=1 Tax=Streptomyces sp. NBC_00704 TaxID=2975809 RepID=UPI002E304AF7|nr:hypothetical protein [Streptomyces sp. NBC_00704]